jgi:hypothetical protein
MSSVNKGARRKKALWRLVRLYKKETKMELYIVTNAKLVGQLEYYVKTIGEVLACLFSFSPHEHYIYNSAL